jgi:hypothetical protein
VPQPQRSRIVPLAVGTAAASGLGMIPVHRLPRPVRAGYVLLPAVLTTGVSLLAMQGRGNSPDEGGEPRLRVDEVPLARTDEASDARADEEPGPRGLRAPTLPEAGICLALSALIAGAGAAGLRLDRGAEGFLRRRGVPAPRLWIGLATGAVTLASTLLDERAPERDGASTREQVLALLTREDPEGLAPGTDRVPEDEYEPEATAIAELLGTGAAPTAAQLDELWEHWFSRPLSPLLGARRMEALLEELSSLASRHPGV